MLSADNGIVQFAELVPPAPSVIRGPREIGFFDTKFLQVTSLVEA